MTNEISCCNVIASRQNLDRTVWSRQVTRSMYLIHADKMGKSAGSNDLGSRQHISAYFKRVRGREAVKNVKVLQSMEGRQLLNAGSRIQEPSVKNVQLQVATVLLCNFHNVYFHSSCCVRILRVNLLGCLHAAGWQLGAVARV